MPDNIIDANHMIHYLKYAATRRLLTKRGKEKETDDWLSAVSPRPFTSKLVLTLLQQSLKKIVTMLGRIRRRQQDSDPNLIHTRPATNSRCQDFIKSVMVQARRLRIEYGRLDCAMCIMHADTSELVDALTSMSPTAQSSNMNFVQSNSKK